MRDPAHGYVAAIGGDVHNYQRYPVAGRIGRVIQYIVSGGGGAFMHATHQIPNIDRCPVSAREDFRCYPLRGDSLSFYSQLYDKKFPGSVADIPPDQAPAILAERLGITPPRPRSQVAHAAGCGARISRVPAARPLRGPWHLLFSEFFDWNDPPLFKSFLRVEAGPGELHIRCFAATGCLGQSRTRPSRTR